MTNDSTPTVVIKGLAVSAGVAIGRAVCVQTEADEVYRIPLGEGEVAAEVERFRRAVERAQEEITSTAQKAREQLGDELAEIFEAHSLFLADRLFLERIEDRIRSERVNAEWAVHHTSEELGSRFASLDAQHMRERAEDLQDVSRYLLRSLQGVVQRDLSEVGGDVIVVASDLTPSEAVRLGRRHVLGFAIESGGQTSHTAIIARSLHLPLVGGVARVTSQVTDDDPIVVDGSAGTVTLHPSEQTIGRYRIVQRELQLLERDLEATRELEPLTRDGTRVELMANVDLPEEIDDAGRFGARGVGLYRSEFLYIEKSPELPTEEEQLSLYRELLDRMAPDPVVIRTYDLGGRKLAREVLDTREDNPVLGLRGVRLTLARQPIFKVQLRALLRAGLDGNLWILVPMVSSLGEIRDFRALVEDVAAELEDEGTPFRRDYALGIMIEVPSAAVTADMLAPEVDFFAIGTNDLIQYSLAVDRNNEHVSYLYRPLHPAILRMIRFVVEAGREAGKEVSICGEMAADPRFTPLLVGLGIRRLSMSPRMIPLVKRRLGQLDASALPALAEECLAQRSSSDVEQALEQFLDRIEDGDGAGKAAGTEAAERRTTG